MTPDRRDAALTAVGAVGSGVLAAWLRRPGLTLGWTGDELANLPPGSLVAQLVDPESGVNPPLWRALIHALASGPDVLVVARAVSDAANVAAVALGVVLARLVGGRWWCGWLAGVLLAVHPWSVLEAPTARAYGLWTLLATLHGLALARWAADDDRRGAWLVAATAVPLPWTHYVSVPWLLLVGVGVAATVPGRRRLPLLYAPAALATLPLAWRVATTTSRRELPVGTVGETLDFLLGLGLRTRALPALAAGPTTFPTNPSWPALVVAAVLLGVALGWRRLRPPLRVAAWMAVALPLTGALLHPLQYVRPTTAVMAVTVAAPLLAAAPTALGPAPLRAIAAAAIALGLALPTRHVLASMSAPDAPREAVRGVARLLHEGRLPGDDAVVIHPRSEATVLFFYLTGQPISRGRHDGPCAGRADCVVLRDRPILPRDAPSPEEPALVVSFARQAPTLPGCVPTPLVEGATGLRCGQPAGAVDAEGEDRSDTP